MGIIIKRNQYVASYDKLAIFIERKLYDYSEAISFNKPFSEELIHVPFEKRSLQVEKCLSCVLGQYEPYTIFRDFDVLFNPDYKIDVLSVLVNAYKINKYSLVWSGKFLDGKLIYSEEGYKDYKVFSVSQYDIICVI